MDKNYTCLYCYKNFIAKKFEKRKFCNSSCAASYNNKRRDRNNVKNKLMNCSLCNTEVEVNKHTSKIHCKKCKPKGIKLRKNKIRRFCKGCKNEFNLYNKIYCENCKYEYFTLYRPSCKFKFSLKDFPEEFDLDLIKKYGWYSPSNKNNNLKGVSRDHMYSVKSGFENSIDPSVISHPANCKLMPHNKNSSKNSSNSISLKNLLERIEEWNTKYL